VRGLRGQLQTRSAERVMRLFRILFELRKESSGILGIIRWSSVARYLIPQLRGLRRLSHRGPIKQCLPPAPMSWAASVIAFLYIIGSLFCLRFFSKIHCLLFQFLLQLIYAMTSTKVPTATAEMIRFRKARKKKSCRLDPRHQDSESTGPQGTL
jgi:hypothetical protein